MTTPAILAFLGAAGIAMCSALFGVGLARVFWAEDLQRTEELQVIWNKTKAAYEGQIEAQDKTIKILNSHLDWSSPQPDPEAR